MQHPSLTQVYAVLFCGVVAVSLAAIFVRFAEAPAIIVASYRMLIASIILLPLSIRSLRQAEFNKLNVRYAVFAGIFLALHFATWITSLSYTTIAASVTLVASQPLWVVLLSWIFQKKVPSFMLIVGILVAIMGVCVIGFGDFAGGSAPLLGDGLALLGALFAAAYLLLGKEAQHQGLSLTSYILIAYGFAALFLLPMPLLMNLPYLSYSATSLMWIALLALIPQLIGHTSINYAMKHLNANLVATLILLEPVGASFFAWLFLHELPKQATIAGAFILLCGVVICIFNSGQDKVTN